MRSQKGEIVMAYDTLVMEAKDLPEDMMEQAVAFIRFLKMTSQKRETEGISGNSDSFCRSVNPLAEDFIAMSEEFDEIQGCFKEYV